MIGNDAPLAAFRPSFFHVGMHTPMHYTQLGPPVVRENVTESAAPAGCFLHAGGCSIV
jgi:hypothetical protein